MVQNHPFLSVSVRLDSQLTICVKESPWTHLLRAVILTLGLIGFGKDSSS